MIGQYFKFNFNFILAFFYIIFVPLAWNIVARLEYNTHFLTKLWCGSKYAGCYFLALCIFIASSLRQVIIYQAIETQPKQLWFFDSPLVQLFGYVVFGLGVIFVASAYYQLGIAGTYLGDYFGILMKEPVTSFPFNALNDPMYDGAAMIFLGEAIFEKSFGGCYLAWHIYTVYKIFTIFYESPFTTHIYEEAAKQKKKD